MWLLRIFTLFKVSWSSMWLFLLKCISEFKGLKEKLVMRKHIKNSISSEGEKIL